MSRRESIEVMQRGLSEAVAQCDWPRARRYTDRLKGILLDSVAQNDPVSIQLVGATFQREGERLGLLADRPSVFNEEAMALQLRADAGTAAIAARIRPSVGSLDSSEAFSDVAALVLAELAKANGPMTNQTLIHRTGKDPAVITRALQRLERQAKIRRWRGTGGHQNNAIIQVAPASSGRMNSLRLTDLSIMSVDMSERKIAQTKMPSPRHGYPANSEGNIQKRALTVELNSNDR